MPRTVIEEAHCPACDGKGLEYTTEPVDLPFMGTSMEILLRCERCGYRHADFVLTEHREPTRYSITVAKADDMMVRVVRSSSGTIRIPELGISVEPGTASEAFVSNVEGILVRVERVLDQLLRDAEDPGLKERIEDLQALLGEMRDGQAPPVTLIIEDPFGNSAILAEHARHERIPDAEAELLKVGMLVYDSDGTPSQGPTAVGAAEATEAVGEAVGAGAREAPPEERGQEHGREQEQGSDGHGRGAGQGSAGRDGRGRDGEA